MRDTLTERFLDCAIGFAGCFARDDTTTLTTRSAHGAEASSGEDVEVEVGDLLAGVRPLVGDEAVARAGEAEFAGYAGGGFEAAGGSGDEGRVGLGEGLDVPVGV